MRFAGIYTGKHYKAGLAMSKIKISDHALVRFLQRVHKIDVEKLRSAVLTERQKKMGSLGDCTINSGKHRYIIKDQTLVTILGDEE